MNDLTDKLLKSFGQIVTPSNKFNKLMTLVDSVLGLVVPKNNAMASCTPWQTYDSSCFGPCCCQYVSHWQHSWCPYPPYDFYRVVCYNYCT